MGIYLTQVTTTCSVSDGGRLSARSAGVGAPLFDEAACRAYLFQLRWPEGFCCPRCGGRKAWPASDVLWECAACHRQVSVTSGTLFQDSRLPLTLWFRG